MLKGNAAVVTGSTSGIGHIADLVVFLGAEPASGLTGAALPIDGGWTAH